MRKVDRVPVHICIWHMTQTTTKEEGGKNEKKKQQQQRQRERGSH